MTTTNLGAPACDMGETNDAAWARAHHALTRLARSRAALDAEEGRWLLAALRAAVHAHLGYATFAEYVERLFGYSARSTQEKLRVAEALEELPATAGALERGELSWSAVRELTRVAVPETERAWLAVAQGKTVHQLQALVAGKERGASPDAPPSSGARRHVLRFEVSAETFSIFREAVDKVRRDSGGGLDDDATLMQVARHVLGGPTDDGRSSYQIALSVCPSCRQGHQQSLGELVSVGEEFVATAECDGQLLDLASVDSGADEVGANAGAHVGAPVLPRAKQSIPPAVRRAVLRRDHHRCRVPGCRNHRFVDVHHVRLHSEGGSNLLSNLVTLCCAHHKAVHRGKLAVAGTASDALSFRHADGSTYGSTPDPHAAEVQTKVFGALRGMGFREGEARRALRELVTRTDGRSLTAESLLREALAMLA